MKFLIDAQLPYSLKEWLILKGHNAGIIVNRQLILLLENNLESILSQLEKRNVVELNNNSIIDHF